MTKQELDTRVEHYRQALETGRITEREFEGFMAALYKSYRGL